jgi:hypothetical protein
MRSSLKVAFAVLSLLLLNVTLSSAGGLADKAAKESGNNSAASAVAIARGALTAHGGEKFRSLKAIKLSGIGSAISPLHAEPVPAEFTMICTDEQIRIDVAVPFGTIQLINDGTRFYNLVNGVSGSFGLASPGKFGLRMLARYDKPGYKVTPLPEQDKKRAFRITGPEGNSTDFYVDAKTNQITSLSYKYNNFEQSWELGDFKEVEGVAVPHLLTLRMGSRAGDYYLILKASDAKINPEINSNTFVPVAE